jgi:hypothetical protein
MKKSLVARTVETIVLCLETQREPLLVLQQLWIQRETGSPSVTPPHHPLDPPAQYLAQYLPPLPALTITLTPNLIQPLKMILTSTLILIPLQISGLFVPEGETTKMDQSNFVQATIPPCCRLA